MLEQNTKFTRLPIKERLIGASALMLALLMPTSLSNLPVNAIELDRGQTFFDSAPRLVESTTSHRTANVSSRYNFTIEVPENAGEALAAVKITNLSNQRPVSFDVSSTSAIKTDQFAQSASIPFANIGGAESADGSEVTIVFAQPVQPGNTVTVSLRARRNPTFGGTYHFGVTAFAEGNNSPGLYLGSGRLQFKRR